MDDHTFLYEIYHENTKLNEVTNDELGQRIFNIYQESYLLYAMSQAYKIYPYKKKFKLNNNFDGQCDFNKVITSRRSIREFVDYNLTIDELSKLFFYSYGITHSIQSMLYGEERTQNFRAVPSGGGLYPLEMYQVLLSSNDLPVGLYHYNVKDHALELLKEGNYRENAKQLMPNQFSLDTASAIIVIAANFDRNTIKYGERGYRFVLFDAGHLMQNVYLSLTSMDLGCYAVGGFLDDDYNDLFELDGHKETVLYCCVVGKGK